MMTFRKILREMESGRIFTCKVVAYDHQRQTGGKVKEYEAVLLQQEAEEQIQAGRPATQAERQKTGISRNPNHRRWYTRNIRLVSDGIPTMVVRKIHIPLVVEFNGETVVP